MKLIQIVQTMLDVKSIESKEQTSNISNDKEPRLEKHLCSWWSCGSTLDY